MYRLEITFTEEVLLESKGIIEYRKIRDEWDPNWIKLGSDPGQLTINFEHIYEISPIIAQFNPKDIKSVEIILNK